MHWLVDPLSFKPQSNKSDKGNNKTPKKKPVVTSDGPSAPPGSSSATQSAPASANVFPIQIRENLVIRIHGLPFDLSKAEAERIANVVRAMAMA